MYLSLSLSCHVSHLACLCACVLLLFLFLFLFLAFVLLLGWFTVIQPSHESQVRRVAPGNVETGELVPTRPGLVGGEGDRHSDGLVRAATPQWGGLGELEKDLGKHTT